MLLKECLGYNVDWTQTPPLTPLQKKQQKEQAEAQTPTPTSTTSTHVKKKIDKNMIRRIDVSELFTNKGKEEKEKDLEAGTASGSGSGSASIDNSPSSSSPTSPTPHIHINTGSTTTRKSKVTVTDTVLPLFYTISPPLEPETPETIYEAKPRHLYSPVLYTPTTPTVYSAITPTTPKVTTSPAVATAATTPGSPTGKASISITTTDMDVSLTSQAIDEGIHGPDDDFQCPYNYQQFQYQLQTPPIPIPVERATTTVVTASPIDDNRFSFVQRISYVENKGMFEQHHIHTLYFLHFSTPPFFFFNTHYLLTIPFMHLLLYACHYRISIPNNSTFLHFHPSSRSKLFIQPSSRHYTSTSITRILKLSTFALSITSYYTHNTDTFKSFSTTYSFNWEAFWF